MIMPAGLIGFTVLIIRERPKYREYTGHPGATKGKVTVSLQSGAIILGKGVEERCLRSVGGTKRNASMCSLPYLQMNIN